MSARRVAVRMTAVFLASMAVFIASVPARAQDGGRGSVSGAYANSWALVIGINAYQQVTPRLNYAVADAKAVAEALPLLGFPVQNTRVLLDGDATKARIETVLYEDFAAMGRQDRLFVFFAGHGVTVQLKGGEEGYLLPVDASPAALPRTALPMDDVKRIGQRVAAKHVLFVMDACFSGFALTRDVVPRTTTDEYLVAALREPVVQVITAGRKGERAIEEGGHGLFTRRFLDGLRLADTDSSGFVTAAQLAAWIELRVVRDSKGRMTPQYGKLEGEGQFFFTRSARPVAETEALEQQRRRLSEERRRLEEDRRAFEGEQRRIEGQRLADEQRRIQEDRQRLEADRRRLEQERQPPPVVAVPRPSEPGLPRPALPSMPTGGEVVLGLQCDRTGPTQIVGVYVCAGYRDYVALANSKGGIERHKIKISEIDHAYKLPPAIESYERHKTEGAVSIAVYGTPHIYALAAKLTEDRIPGTSPGFGSAAAADGTRYPYIFPVAATYWSQGAAAVDFVKKQLGGSLRDKKIAYLFYDNPAGREPISLLEDLREREGFALKMFAVPPPGIEMGAQVLDIAQRYRADFVIAHLFGGAPSVSIKELKRVGYPLHKVVSFSWGAGEANIEGAGGFGAAEGYYTMQFAGVGADYPVLNEIREMYRKQGEPAPKEMASTVFYNRGVLVAAIQVEALRNALRAKPDGRVTGADVKAGFERIRGFTLGGLVPPLEITATDHEGGGWVQIWQVKGGKFERVTDWFKAYRDVVNRQVQAAAAAR